MGSFFAVSSRQLPRRGRREEGTLQRESPRNALGFVIWFTTTLGFFFSSLDRRDVRKGVRVIFVLSFGRLCRGKRSSCRTSEQRRGGGSGEVSFSLCLCLCSFQVSFVLWLFVVSASRACFLLFSFLTRPYCHGDSWSSCQAVSGNPEGFFL
jgi:hypothetical protein